MKYKLITGIIFLFTVINVWASHEAGGEIVYRSLGGKQYEVKYFIIRDCRGIPLINPDFKVSDGTTSFNLAATRQSITDISNLCKKLSPCDPQNSTISAFGFEQHLFIDTIDFSVAPFNYFIQNNICEVYFSYSLCCRNSAITTMTAGTFYLESMLNLCTSKPNSSPEFYTKPLMFACCNQPFVANFGGYDYRDFDSLSVELVDALNAHGSKESYNGSYSARYPMTPYCPPNPGVLNCMPIPMAQPPRGVYFNNANGNYIITPTNCSEVAVVCAQITEWRKDGSGVFQKIGYVRRDIQIHIVDCGLNVLPKLSNVHDSYEFNLNTPNCISFTVCDILVSGESDSMDIEASVLPLGATLTIADSVPHCKRITLCWTPHDSDCLRAKHYGIVLKISDYACPYRGIVFKTLNIILKGNCGNLGVGHTVFDDPAIHVYPNPSAGILYVNAPGLPADNLIDIIDSKGMTVQQSTLVNNGAQMDIHSLSGGVYFIKMIVPATGQVFIKPFIKE